MPANALLGSFLSLLCLLGLCTLPAPGQTSSEPCSASALGDYPKATISNGLVQAVLYLPDPQHGYYRASRFDWSGVIPCLAYKGHTYFGTWFSHYDPMIADAIEGPVEEFRSSDGDSSPGYQETPAGGLFVKPGVGVLRKIDDSPYHFMYTYPLVDGGKWQVRATRSSVSFRQRIHSTIGVAYDYQKIVRLEGHQPVLVLEHHLKNTGAKVIDTQVYDHDFFMLDGAATGPGMIVKFPFPLQAQQPLEPLAKIDGQAIVFTQPLQAHQSAASFLTGYSSRPSDYDIVVEDQTTGAGVEQTGDTAISRLNFWSIRTTICPEAYIHLVIPPGQTASWKIRYRFYAK